MDDQTIFDYFGPDVNPGYIREILKKNETEILIWLLESMTDTLPTLQEAILRSSSSKFSTLDLDILKTRIKGWLFFLKEIRSRTEAPKADFETKPLITKNEE